MRLIRRWYLFITKFCYYGYIGATQCYDFDSNCVHNLIYAHIKRVKKFMHSDNTHLLWNDSDTKLMRRLDEFTELSRRMSENDMHNYYYYDKFKEDHPDYNVIGLLNSEDPVLRKKVHTAFKKDRMTETGLRERYNYMLIKYLPSFWD